MTQLGWNIHPHGLPPSWHNTDDDPARWPGSYADLVNTYAGALTDTRIIAHGGNEPGLNPATVEWNMGFAEHCLARGLRAVLLNQSVGTITADNVGLLRPLIEIINAHPGRLYLGIHAYTPLNWQNTHQWLLGNYKEVLRYCDREGLDDPDMMFTEAGYDTRRDGLPNWSVAEAVRYYEAVGHLSPEKAAADTLIEAWNAVCAEDPNIVGACFYCWGEQTEVWRPYNAIPWRGFVDHLVAGWPDKRGQETEPPIKVEPLPDWWVWLLWFLREKIGLDV